MEGTYRGGHAFLLAKGPSVQELDLKPLHNRWVMTLNNGAKTFRGNANCSLSNTLFSVNVW
jgi:hypothetical protein